MLEDSVRNKLESKTQLKTKSQFGKCSIYLTCRQLEEGVGQVKTQVCIPWEFEMIALGDHSSLGCRGR